MILDGYQRTQLARLMSSPANQLRRDAREACPLSAKQLESRASKFLTLADEYAKRRTFARIMAKPPSNVVPSWAHRLQHEPAEHP